MPDQQLLVLMVPGDIRDDVIDALIETDGISGFNMQTIAGYSREHIIRCGVWLDDTRDFWSFNKVYAEYFGGEHAPARACVQSMMMVDCKVEIDCICYKPPTG